MDKSPAAQGRCANPVVERKLDELCASLDSALSSPLLLCPDAERRLVEDVKAKTDFLRSLLVAERAGAGNGARPAYLVEAEARFGVLEATFDQWARRVGVAPAAVEEEKEMKGQPEEEEDDARSAAECSCTDSCQEVAAAGDAEVDADRAAVEPFVDATADAEVDADRAAVEAFVDATREEEATDATEKKGDTEHPAAVETKRSAGQRRWWRRSAAWCGAAGVVAVVAFGLAVELAAVARHNVGVYVVPT